MVFDFLHAMARCDCLNASTTACIGCGFPRRMLVQYWVNRKVAEEDAEFSKRRGWTQSVVLNSSRRLRQNDVQQLLGTLLLFLISWRYETSRSRSAFFRGSADAGAQEDRVERLLM